MAELNVERDAEPWHEYDEEPDCTWCGGEGYDDCDDPIQCFRKHTPGGLCPCGACGGSGRGKDQVIW